MPEVQPLTSDAIKLCKAAMVSGIGIKLSPQTMVMEHLWLTAINNTSDPRRYNNMREWRQIIEQIRHDPAPLLALAQTILDNGGGDQCSLQI